MLMHYAQAGDSFYTTIEMDGNGESQNERARRPGDRDFSPGRRPLFFATFRFRAVKMK